MNTTKKLLTPFFFIVVLALEALVCPTVCVGAEQDNGVEVVPVFQKGIAYSSWRPDDFSSLASDESLALLSETNAEWVSICFSWYQNSTTSTEIYFYPEMSASTESVRHAIAEAHSLGLKVMLKPMVDTLEEETVKPYEYVWRGEIPPSDEWFDSYSEFMNFFAAFAQENDVELFCIGCELKATTVAKEQWENVIAGVREHYAGPITYAADGTNFKNITWWDNLDYAGIDAYFPLALFDNDPTFDELVDVWTNHAEEIEEWHATVNKPVIFTEIGYRSGNGTSMAPSNFWSQMAVDLQEQRDCYEAAFQTLWNKSWFYGFYWWTWTIYPDHGGPTDAGHSPQNKPAQDVITQWYSKTRQVAVIDQTFTSKQRTSVSEIQTVAFHVSWEDDGTNVADAKVYVNGTEYTTNSSGWISFDYAYNSVGKQVWTVTGFSHPQATTYKMTTEKPYIVWDRLVVDVQVGSFMLGATIVRAEIRYASDNTLVTDATTRINGQLSPETETGVYETEILSWSPFSEMTIQVVTSDLPQQTQTAAAVNSANIILYAGIIAAIAIILFMLLKRKTKITTNKTDTNQ